MLSVCLSTTSANLLELPVHLFWTRKPLLCARRNGADSMPLLSLLSNPFVPCIFARAYADMVPFFRAQPSNTTLFPLPGRCVLVPCEPTALAHATWTGFPSTSHETLSSPVHCIPPFPSSALRLALARARTCTWCPSSWMPRVEGVEINSHRVKSR